MVVQQSDVSWVFLVWGGELKVLLLNHLVCVRARVLSYSLLSCNQKSLIQCEDFFLITKFDYFNSHFLFPVKLNPIFFPWPIMVLYHPTPHLFAPHIPVLLDFLSWFLTPSRISHPVLFPPAFLQIVPQSLPIHLSTQLKRHILWEALP